MKKLLSIVLALALVISLVPTVAFAAGETKTFDLGKTTAKDSNADDKGCVAELVAPDGISYIADESTELEAKNTKVRIEYSVFQIETESKKEWATASENQAKVTFTAELGTDAAAGWYRIDFTGGDVYAASDLYIYANDTYVGKYEPDKTVAKIAVGRKATYGAVYLTPDSEGKVKFMVAVAKRGLDKSGGTGTYTNGRILLSSLSLTYLGGEESDYGYKISHNMPNELDITADVAGVEFTAYADAGDGIPRAMNGINSDRNADTTKITDSFKAEIVSGDSVALTSTVTDGIASGTLVPVKAGDTTIKFTAVINEETYTDTKTVTVTEATAEDTDDSVAAPENVSYIVRGSTTEFNAGINMTGYTAGDVESHPINTSFTATAKDKITVGDKKYNFAYWQTAGGSPIEGAGASYTFTPKSNFTLEAVYGPAEPTEADKKVQFWNYNRVYLGEKTVTDGKVSEMPTQPTLAGHSFTGWAAENIGAFTADTQLTTALTRVVAQFTAVANKYSVKVDGVEVDKYAYGATFSKTADETKDTQVFSHWAIGDNAVSYDRTISFCVWNNVELTAVYADAAPTAVPTVVLDNIDDEYFITYEVPAGYTPVDAGIVFGTAGTTPRVDSTDGSKASVKSATAKGQFTAAPGDSTHTVARGYVMYKVDATGDIRVLYTK